MTHTRIKSSPKKSHSNRSFVYFYFFRIASSHLEHFQLRRRSDVRIFTVENFNWKCVIAGLLFSPRASSGFATSAERTFGSFRSVQSLTYQFIVCPLIGWRYSRTQSSTRQTQMCFGRSPPMFPIRFTTKFRLSPLSTSKHQHGNVWWTSARCDYFPNDDATQRTSSNLG